MHRVNRIGQMWKKPSVVPTIKPTVKPVMPAPPAPPAPLAPAPTPKLKFNENPRDIAAELPDFEQFQSDVRRAVRDNWNNPNLLKRSTYSKSGEVKDIDFFMADDVLNDNDIYTLGQRPTADAMPNMNEQKMLNDISTDFNVIHMFSNRQIRARLIYVVVQCISNAFEEMYQLDPSLTAENLNIMFKGGITLRFIVQDMTRDFVSSVEDYITSLVKKITKISDFDFEVISSPDMPEPVLNKVNMIVFILLGMMRNYMSHHNHLFFDLFSHSLTKQKSLVKKYGRIIQRSFDKLDSSNYFYGARVDAVEYTGPCTGTNDKLVIIDSNYDSNRSYKYLREDETPTCRSDFALIIDRTTTQVRGQPGNELSTITAGKLLEKFKVGQSYSKLFRNRRATGNRLYCTYNPEIAYFAGGKDIHFQLNRIKYNYTLHVYLNGKFSKFDAPGEVVDISSAYADDRRKAKYAVNNSSNTYLKKYNFLNNNLSYISYSIDGHIADINTILFDETEYKPWTEEKYVKRLYRVVIMYIFQYFSMPEPNYTDKLKMLDTIRTRVQKSTNGTLASLDVQDKKLQALYDRLARVVNKSNGAPELNGFLKELSKIFDSMYKALQVQQRKTANQRLSQDSLGEYSLDIQYPRLYGGGAALPRGAI